MGSMAISDDEVSNTDIKYSRRLLTGKFKAGDVVLEKKGKNLVAFLVQK